MYKLMTKEDSKYFNTTKTYLQEVSRNNLHYAKRISSLVWLPLCNESVSLLTTAIYAHFLRFDTFGFSVLTLFLEIKTDDISAVSGTAKIIPRLDESPVMTSRDIKAVENR